MKNAPAWLRALLMSPTERRAQQKRAIEAAAREAGCSKTQAAKVASIYFARRLENLR